MHLVINSFTNCNYATRKNEQSCGALNIPIAKSTLSHHFKVLRESGVMYTRLEGTQRFISIREDDLNARFPVYWMS